MIMIIIMISFLGFFFLYYLFPLIGWMALLAQLIFEWVHKHKNNNKYTVNYTCKTLQMQEVRQ